MSLHTRLRPWHAVMLTVFVVGAGTSLFRAGSYAYAEWFQAVLSGLFASVFVRLTVGNLWGYAVEYRSTGRRWSDSVFLAPFAVASVVAIGVALATGEVWASVWVGFWAFVVAAGVVATGTWFVVGYRHPDA